MLILHDIFSDLTLVWPLNQVPELIVPKGKAPQRVVPPVKAEPVAKAVVAKPEPGPMPELMVPRGKALPRKPPAAKPAEPPPAPVPQLVEPVGKPLPPRKPQAPEPDAAENEQRAPVLATPPLQQAPAKKLPALVEAANAVDSPLPLNTPGARSEERVQTDQVCYVSMVHCTST